MKMRHRKLIINYQLLNKNRLLGMLAEIAKQLKEKMKSLTEEERLLPVMLDIRAQGEPVRKPGAARFELRDYQRQMLQAIKK